MSKLISRAGAVLAASALFGFLGVSAASASVVPVPATPQCHVTANCVTPDVFRSAGNEPSLAHPVLAKNAAVVLATADTSDPAQDWRVTDYGTVAALTNNGDGPFQFGLTNEDWSLYASDHVYGMQAAPGGFLSNLCLANINGMGVLRPCRVGRWQRFIAATGSEFGIPMVQPDGVYGLSIVKNNSAAGHNALTGSTGQVFFSAPTGVNNQNWDNFDQTPDS